MKPAIGAITDGYQGLGYRGVIVEALSDTVAAKYDLPDTFRIGHVPGADDVIEKLLRSMVKANVLDDDLRATVEQAHHLAAWRGETTEPAFEGLQAGRAAEQDEGKAPPPQCTVETAVFNPGFWNDPSHVSVNNCYNYASNRRTDTFAQPGRASGHPITAYACDKVTAAALSDGLHHHLDCFPDSEKPRWLVAMVVAPGYDYHWYRRQHGFWGHKPGQTPAKNTDNNGAVVVSPETCARAPYTKFCGYFYIPKSQKIR